MATGPICAVIPSSDQPRVETTCAYCLLATAAFTGSVVKSSTLFEEKDRAGFESARLSFLGVQLIAKSNTCTARSEAYELLILGTGHAFA